MVKKTFTIDAEKVLEALSLYSYEDMGLILEGLCRFELYGEVVELEDKGLQMVYKMLAIDIKRNDEKYLEKSARNKADYQRRKDINSENSDAENAENNSADSERDRKGKEGKGKEGKGKDINNLGDKSPSRFQKPSLAEIKQYIRDMHYTSSAESIFNYYESNGWKVGRNPMKDWKAAVRNWESNEKRGSYKKRISDINERSEEEIRSYMDDLNDPTAMF